MSSKDVPNNQCPLMQTGVTLNCWKNSWRTESVKHYSEFKLTEPAEIIALPRLWIFNMLSSSGMEKANNICKYWLDVLSSRFLQKVKGLQNHTLSNNKVLDLWPTPTHIHVWLEDWTRAAFNLPEPTNQFASVTVVHSSITKISDIFWCMFHFPFVYFVV